MFVIGSTKTVTSVILVGTVSFVELVALPQFAVQTGGSQGGDKSLPVALKLIFDTFVSNPTIWHE